MNEKPGLCGVVLDAPVSEMNAYLNHPRVEFIEWRLDYYIRRYSMHPTIQAMNILSASPRHPVIATNRPAREGGVSDLDEKTRIDVLLEAAKAGAEWIDLENDVPLEVLDRFKSCGSHLVLSHHHFSGTPDGSELKRMAAQMAKKGTPAIKIATYAHSQEDNLRVLELIPFVRREFGIDMIAFCMGPQGLWSRFVCLLLGSPWVYVQLPGQDASAPGQISADQMRTLLDAGKWMFDAAVLNTPAPSPIRRPQE